MKRSQSFAVIICGIALLAFAGMLKPEPVPAPSPPEPTAKAVLARLDELGAKYKLNQFDQVYWLWLKQLPLSDDDLQILHELPQITYLNMRGIHDKEGNTLTDAGLKHLVNLNHLETLDLSANYQLTDQCTRWLGRVTNLRKLNLSQTDITVASLPVLSQLRNLQWLNLSCCSGMELTESTLPFFRNMPLRMLLGVRITRDNLPLLSKLTNLEDLPNQLTSEMRDIDLVHIRHIKKIDSLSVTLTNGWSDASQLKHLQALPNLKYLSISPASEWTGTVDRDGIRSLGNVPALRKLNLGRANDDVLQALSHCPQITVLDLTSTTNEFTPAGVEVLKQMQNLKALAFPREKITDELLQTVSQIESLEVLTLDSQNLFPNYYSPRRKPMSRPFSIQSLGLLSRLPHLKSLSLTHWHLGDEALEYLSRISTLEILSIANYEENQPSARISEPALLRLRHLPNLKYLDMIGTTVGREAALRLHEFLPECYITDNWCCGCLSIGPSRRGFFDWRNIAYLDR